MFSEIALQFTNYLVKNKFLKVPGVMRKEELIKLFDFYLLTNYAPVKCADILPILDEAHLLKRRNISSPENKTSFVEFKPSVFDIGTLNELKP